MGQSASAVALYGIECRDLGLDSDEFVDALACADMGVVLERATPGYPCER